ncbi:Trihelix transcription factor GT-3b [Orobanche gracilis]
MDHGHHHHLHYQYSAVGLNNIDTVGGSDNRFPQWSNEETQDFLMIRAELDQTFMETKRNKLLWEVISTRMREKGYNRSADQCKCKWKNLVTRYKGCETMEAEGLRQQFPFYNELQAIFTGRMQRMLWQEAEGGGGGGGGSTGSRKKTTSQFSSDEEDENYDYTSEGEKCPGGSKRKKKMKITNTNSNNNNSSMVIINGIREMMDEFMKQQMEVEMQWLKAYERREEERRVKEMEWREKMEALENERIMMERRWREREEQRKIREEQRADKRDALITALLNNLN